MLLVVFYIGKERFALDATQVFEIVPMVLFKSIPKAPDYIRGLFHYRGQIVPVVDLSRLLGTEGSRHFLSTRIILVQSSDGEGRSVVLGLLAERVTDTLEVERGDLTQTTIKIKDAPYLGDVITDAEGIILCINVDDLLPPPVKEMLYSGR